MHQRDDNSRGVVVWVVSRCRLDVRHDLFLGFSVHAPCYRSCRWNVVVGGRCRWRGHWLRCRSRRLGTLREQSVAAIPGLLAQKPGATV